MKRYYVYEFQPGGARQVSHHESALRAQRAARRRSREVEQEVYAELHTYRWGQLDAVITVGRYQRGEQVG